MKNSGSFHHEDKCSEAGAPHSFLALFPVIERICHESTQRWKWCRIVLLRFKRFSYLQWQKLKLNLDLWVLIHHIECCNPQLAAGLFELPVFKGEKDILEKVLSKQSRQSCFQNISEERYVQAGSCRARGSLGGGEQNINHTWGRQQRPSMGVCTPATLQVSEEMQPGPPLVTWQHLLGV